MFQLFILCVVYSTYRLYRAGIFKQSMEAKNRGGIRLSYRPARLHKLAELIPWNRFLGSIKVYKFGLRLPSDNRKWMNGVSDCGRSMGPNGCKHLQDAIQASRTRDNNRMHSWQLVREIILKVTVLLGFNADPDPAFQLICIQIHVFDDQKL